MLRRLQTWRQRRADSRASLADHLDAYLDLAVALESMRLPQKEPLSQTTAGQGPQDGRQVG
jgi:hypothetical protein